MAKMQYISSYADAEMLGMTGFDSLISTVAIPGRKPKIVAFPASHTFSSRDKGKYTLGRLLVYQSADGYKYYATSTASLGVLLRALFVRKPRMFRVSFHQVR